MRVTRRGALKAGLLTTIGALYARAATGWARQSLAAGSGLRLHLPYVAFSPTPTPEPSTIGVIDHRSVNCGSIPQYYLDQARQIKTFFCHHSVGNDIMAGMADLAAQNPGRYSINGRLDPPATWFDTNTGIGHRSLDYGTNGRPDLKASAFDGFMRGGGYGSRVRVAFMKFCYVDLPAPNSSWGWGTIPPDRVWNEHYRPIMAGLEAAYPGVIMIWWTCPLLNAAQGHGNNHKATYNALVRNYCASYSKPLFDIAAIQSHRPDGSLVLDGSGYEAMDNSYTYDGGHLNATGRQRVAGAFWWLLARVAGWRW
jgi:hypothetical protein